MTANWVVMCRHAKSARCRELRLEVYTLDRGAFSTLRPPSTVRRPGLDFSAVGTLSWEYALADIDGCDLAGVCPARSGRRRAAGLAAPAPTSCSANIRRAVTELEPRPPRRRPGRGARPAGVCGRRGHGRVRRRAGRADTGVDCPSRRPAHDL